MADRSRSRSRSPDRGAPADATPADGGHDAGPAADGGALGTFKWLVDMIGILDGNASFSI